MLKSKKVQDSVKQKLLKTSFNGHTVLLCLTGYCVERYHHIPQEVRVNLPELAKLHGKCDDIGRTRAAQVCLVELSYLRIIHNEDG